MTERGEVENPPISEREPHLRDYLRVLYTRRWILMGTVFLVVLAALIWVLTRTPVYRPTCRLLLQPTRANVISIKDVYDPTFGAAAGGHMLRRQFLETQYRLILSRPLLEKTFRNMGFAEMKEFAEAREPLRSFGKLFSVAGVRNSLLATVSFEWKDPKLATDTLDYHVKQYILSCRQRALGVNEEGLIALRAKAEDLRPKLEAKAEELQKFMADHNLVSLEQSQDIIVERLKELSRNHTKTEAGRIAAESRYSNILAALSAERSPEEMPEVVDSQTVRDLKLEYVRTKLQCSSREGSLGANHPEVKAARATLKMITEKLETEVRSVLASAQAEFLRARQEEAELGAALAEQEKAVMEFNRLAAKYRVLKDAHATLSATYHTVAKRIEEIEISIIAGAKDEGVVVDEPPEVPARPAKPRRRLSLMLAGILGLGLGIALCFFVEYLDTTVKTKEDIEALIPAPVLGYVPSLQDGQVVDGKSSTGPLELMSVERPRSAAAEGFRSIRTALSFTRSGKKCHQFVVTSALPSEGKTLVSINIALALAQTGKKVLLVDADLRRPRIHKIFGLESSPGLSNLLAGDEELAVDAVIRKPGLENLHVIASGPIPPNPAELLSSARMGDILKELSGPFDYVVFDSPPVINVTDASVLCQRVDGGLLVVRAFATDRSAVGRARELLDGAGARVLGVVVNGADTPRGAYQYEQYYYYNYYHDYYGKKGKGKRRRGRSREPKAQPS